MNTCRKPCYFSCRKSSFLLACASFLAVAVAASPQTPQRSQPSGQQFAGTWKAAFQGKTIIVLHLDATGSIPSGTIRLAGFQLDLEGDGALMAVTDERLDSPLPLRHIKFQGNTLSFEFVDHDGDTDKFKLELADRNTAKLVWTELPKGMQAQPISIVRQTLAKKGKA